MCCDRLGQVAAQKYGTHLPRFRRGTTKGDQVEVFASRAVQHQEVPRRLLRAEVDSLTTADSRSLLRHMSTAYCLFMYACTSLTETSADGGPTATKRPLPLVCESTISTVNDSARHTAPAQARCRYTVSRCRHLIAVASKPIFLHDAAHH